MSGLSRRFLECGQVLSKDITFLNACTAIFAQCLFPVHFQYGVEQSVRLTHQPAENLHGWLKTLLIASASVITRYGTVT